MIKPHWRSKETGETWSRVSVTWDLSTEEIAGLIIAQLLPYTREDLARTRTKAELEKAVRRQLARNAEKRFWWSDEYAEDYRSPNFDSRSEPTVEEVQAWGMAQAELLIAQAKGN